MASCKGTNESSLDQKNNSEASRDENVVVGQSEQEAMTIVTSSTVPSEIEEPTTAVCPRRLVGQVCVCPLCEAARLRLLNRRQAQHASAKRKQPEPRETSSDETAHDDDDINDNTNPKRRATASAKKTSDDESPTTAEVGSFCRPTGTPMTEQDRLLKMSAACRTILECIGEDPRREGLVKTPERWAKALLYMCHGYKQTPAEVTNDAVFSENHDEMVVVRNIDIHSLCEHHMVPFSGRVHIGYIPNGQIVGLSKLARIAELYARRLQVQERLTRQIADAVVETVQPLGVAVVVECTHFCMVMRGVQKTSAVTTTSSVRGCFESNPKTRAEFFSILHGNSRNC